MFDAIVCCGLDGLNRQPRRLEDWIDAAELRGLALVTADGDADLCIDGGDTYPRIKAAVASAEMERKGTRQSAAQLQRAKRIPDEPPFRRRANRCPGNPAVPEHPVTLSTAGARDDQISSCFALPAVAPLAFALGAGETSADPATELPTTEPRATEVTEATAPDTSASEPAAPAQEQSAAQPAGTWDRAAQGWRYFDADGTPVTNQVKEVDGVTYAFDATGHVARGWWRDPEGRWYLSFDTGVRTGWQREGATFKRDNPV